MKLKLFTISFVSFSLIGLLLILLAGGVLTAPHPRKIGSPPNNIPAESFTISNNNGGGELKGWYVKGKKELGGVLLMHGVRSNRLQMLNRAIFLYEAGYSVLLFDFQAHGESTGKSITFGHLESNNADIAYDYFERRLVNKSITVIGVSLGGAAALLSSIPYKAKAIIIESVYPTIEEAVNNRICMRLGGIGKYLSPLLLWQLKPRLGVSPEELRPIDHIGKVKGAIMVIAGENDLHTTLSESKRMYNKANMPKEFWGIPNAVHVDFCSFKPNEYKNKILEFLNKSMSN